MPSVDRLNALFQQTKRYGFTSYIYDFEELLERVNFEMFIHAAPTSLSPSLFTASKST